jgi:RNA polymerase sigma-70 factor (ECF subfamily)
VNRGSEKHLAHRIAAGDREACVQLIQLHQAAIYRFLVHLAGDAHRAEDLVQDTFAAAWAAIDTFRGGSSLATWLHRIAYRKFADALRRKPRIAFEPATAVDDVRSAGPDPLEEVLAEEQSRRLYQALARLADTDRDVVVLHYLQGLSFADMAAVLDEPVGTAKWRTHQALARLKSLLEGRLDDEPGKATRAAAPQDT